MTRGILTAMGILMLTGRGFTGTDPQHFSLAELRDDGWSLRWEPSDLRSSGLLIGGVSHRLFSGDIHPGVSRQGWPGLPAFSFSLGIPVGAEIEVALAEPQYEVIRDIDIAPVPTYESVGDTDIVALYVRDRDGYGQNSFIPADEISVSSVWYLRGQRIASIRLAPYRYNPATRVLRRLAAARIEVRLSAGRRKSTALLRPGAGEMDPWFEDVFRNLLVNYEEARGWREPGASLRGNAVDSTGGWFEPGKQYIRVSTAADGWHRVESADLLRAGFPVSGVDPSTIKMLIRGKQVPLVVRQDGAVEFFGFRNKSDSAAIDFYTDTTACWLTWGGVPGLRYAQVPEIPGPPDRVVRSAPVTVHLEENRSYYFGTTLREVSDNAEVPGEGWVWEYYFPNSSFEHPFVLDSLDTGFAAVARVRLYSTTLRYNVPDHHARFWMNDSLLGEMDFRGRDEARFSSSLPAGWIRTGTNSIRVESIPTLSSPNQFYLDWIEIDCHQFLRATGDQVVFTAQSAPAPEKQSFVISGFRSASIEVYDLTGNRALSGLTLGGDSLSGFTVTFNDTVGVPRRYLVRSTFGSLQARSAVSRVFEALRNPATGADYLIVTHGAFRTAADQLGAHREAVSGIRAAVVDVQDIYDQFNFGILHVDAIKRFVQHAYEFWPPPAPAFLVFVGDASEDSRRYIASSTKTEFIPAYGHPAGDNWYACFDSTYPYLPSMMIGRLPFEDSIQAGRTIEKIKRFDMYTLGDWSKKQLFITGGNSESERASFNALSEGLIQDYVTPAPLGAVPLRVYKTTSQVIDGESKQSIREMVREGLLFMNFLGHSGGRIWNVDIGSPNDLENTNGRLPFVSSVSCNIANFASAYENTLSEDFLMADNRGAIAVWGSSSLGYANTGTALVRHFLDALANDTLRTFGSLTTAARFRLWETSGAGYLNVAHINLTPLVGDPLSRIAVPRQPDLALEPEDIVPGTQDAAMSDSGVTVKVRVRNYGLVPSDSVGVQLDDVHEGVSRRLVAERIPPVYWRDSVSAMWNLSGRGGRHTLAASVDPGGRIAEVDETNNSRTLEQYVYVNRLTVLKPFTDALVPPGSRRLVVAAEDHAGLPAGVTFAFELDTIATFDSPFRTVSGPVFPGRSAVVWNTAPLASPGLYFWRARMEQGGLFGQWSTASFFVSPDAPTGSVLRWRQSEKSQFHSRFPAGTIAADSGVTIQPGERLTIYVRSLGYRSDVNTDYYSQITLNDEVFLGYWWIIGSSYMVLRVNEFTSRFDFRPFNIASNPAQADSMAAFLETTPDGHYVAIGVILDGSANMTPRLRSAIESLGSTEIGQLGFGDAWSLVSRKGAGGPATALLESRSVGGITEDSLIAPTLYSRGSGSYLAELAPADEWRSFRWLAKTIPGVTDARIHFLGERYSGARDTIRTLPPDSSSVGGAFLTAAANDTSYRTLLASIELSTADATRSPVLESWEADLIPAGDVGVSPVAVAVQPSGAHLYDRSLPLRLPLLVENHGYAPLDSARVTVHAAGPSGDILVASQMLVGPVGADSGLPGEIEIPGAGLPGRMNLLISVARADGKRDLFHGNNRYEFVVAPSDGAGGLVQLVADGVPLVEGDYVASRPSVSIRAAAPGVPGLASSMELFVDDTRITAAGTGRNGKSAAHSSQTAPPASQDASPGDEPVFRLDLAPGLHELKALVIRETLLGIPDTLTRRVTVTVTDQQRIERLYNYPNPFSAQTDITFIVTGSGAPEGATIRIFTVTGRRVRRIELLPGSVQVGFNRVLWDGRDDDGDDVANGVYFLQLEVKSGDRTITALEKMARVR